MASLKLANDYVLNTTISQMVIFVLVVTSLIVALSCAANAENTQSKEDFKALQEKGVFQDVSGNDDFARYSLNNCSIRLESRADVLGMVSEVQCVFDLKKYEDAKIVSAKTNITRIENKFCIEKKGEDAVYLDLSGAEGWAPCTSRTEIKGSEPIIDQTNNRVFREGCFENEATAADASEALKLLAQSCAE